MLKKIGEFLTSEYTVGFGVGVLTAIILSLENINIWQEIKSCQQLLAGIFAIIAGYFIWLAKKEEIEETRIKEKTYGEKFKAKYLGELHALRRRLHTVANFYTDNDESTTLARMAELGILEDVRTFMHSQDNCSYLKYLNSQSITDLVELNARLNRVNINISYWRKTATTEPETRFANPGADDEDATDHLYESITHALRCIEAMAGRVDKKLWDRLNS